MIRPGPLATRSMVGIGLTTLLIPLAPTVVWLSLAALSLLIGAALVEALWLGGVRLSLERRTSQVLSLGQPETVTLALRTQSARGVSILLRQVWPEIVTPRVSLVEGHCRPGEILRLDLLVRGIERGRAAVGSAYGALRIWGLVERIVRLEAQSEIRVYPDLRSIGRLHGQLNDFALRGLGSRVSARLGKGREFDRLREYVRGDEYRDLAWRASARHRKLIVREYRLDRSQDVLLCLDSGHRMAARVAGLSRLDHAVNGALLLAYVCNRMEDRVGAVSFATSVGRGPRQGRGGVHLRRLTDFTAAQRPAYVHSDYLGLASEIRGTLRHRALIVIFTALPELESDTLLRAVRLISPPHLVLVVVQRDPDLEAATEILPASKAELSRTLVAHDLWWVRQHAMRELRRRGALVVESSSADVGVAAMNAYIDVKRRQML